MARKSATINLYLHWRKEYIINYSYLDIEYDLLLSTVKSSKKTKSTFKTYLAIITINMFTYRYQYVHLFIIRG